MMTSIQLCNPAVEAGKDCEFAEFWTSIRRAPDSFVARFVIPTYGPLRGHLAQWFFY
jgi:hypothetical protein